jgi:hypothetical protein
VTEWFAPHRRRIRTNNALERILREIRRRTRVVQRPLGVRERLTERDVTSTCAGMKRGLRSRTRSSTTVRSLELISLWDLAVRRVAFVDAAGLAGGGWLCPAGWLGA